jgi:winged helix DNA-binding protein
MRITVHLISMEDAAWMLPLFEPKIEKWSRRRMGQLGLSEAKVEKALGLVAKSLAAEGPLTRRELADHVVSRGIELDASQRLHLTLTSVSSGIACIGPDRGRTGTLVAREDWIGPQPAFDRDAALAELARRYLAAFGPADDRDLARWSGLSLGDCRAGLAAIASEAEEVRYGDAVLLSLKKARARLPRSGQIRMLGAFDTYVLGYASRDFAVDPSHGERINTRGGGMIEPVVVRDGEFLGRWTMKRGAKKLAVETQPFTPWGREVDAALEAEIQDIGRFEGLETKRA